MTLNPNATAKPLCNVDSRGTFWVNKGGAGVADAVQVCLKKVDESYGWSMMSGSAFPSGSPCGADDKGLTGHTSDGIRACCYLKNDLEGFSNKCQKF